MPPVSPVVPTGSSDTRGCHAASYTCCGTRWGTTGFPKGAITTHENFLSNCETCRRILRLDIHGSGLRTLVSVPLFHVTGCNSQLLVAVYLGGTTVIMPQFEVGAFLEAIEAERIDVLTTVPAIYW